MTFFFFGGGGIFLAVLIGLGCPLEERLFLVTDPAFRLAVCGMLLRIWELKKKQAEIFYFEILQLRTSKHLRSAKNATLNSIR